MIRVSDAGSSEVVPRALAGVRKPSMDETAGRDTWAVPGALWGFGRRE
jgi:hypothetical protein